MESCCRLASSRVSSHGLRSLHSTYALPQFPSSTFLQAPAALVHLGPFYSQSVAQNSLVSFGFRLLWSHFHCSVYCVDAGQHWGPVIDLDIHIQEVRLGDLVVPSGLKLHDSYCNLEAFGVNLRFQVGFLARLQLYQPLSPGSRSP